MSRIFPDTDHAKFPDPTDPFVLRYRRTKGPCCAAGLASLSDSHFDTSVRTDQDATAPERHTSLSDSSFDTSGRTGWKV
jgi:hypothetical protein